VTIDLQGGLHVVDIHGFCGHDGDYDMKIIIIKKDEEDEEDEEYRYKRRKEGTVYVGR
jgi:hypothetical protein